MPAQIISPVAMVEQDVAQAKGGISPRVLRATGAANDQMIEREENYCPEN